MAGSDLYFKTITLNSNTLLRMDFRGPRQKEVNQSGRCCSNLLPRGDGGLDQGGRRGGSMEWLASEHFLKPELTTFPAGMKMECQRKRKTNNDFKVWPVKPQG